MAGSGLTNPSLSRAANPNRGRGRPISIVPRCAKTMLSMQCLCVRACMQYSYSYSTPTVQASHAGEKGETGSCKLRLSSGGPTTIHSLCAQSSLHCTALHSAAAPPSPIIHRSLSCSAHTARLMTTADALATHPIVFFPSGGGPLGRRGRRSVDGGRGPRGRARPVPAGCMHAHMYQ